MASEYNMNSDRSMNHLREQTGTMNTIAAIQRWSLDCINGTTLPPFKQPKFLDKKHRLSPIQEFSAYQNI